MDQDDANSIASGGYVMNQMDLMSSILDYEMGILEDTEVVELFQELVNTGLAWTLQGSYGRTARDLIEQGVITS
jgi:hypothetical protein